MVRDVSQHLRRLQEYRAVAPARASAYSAIRLADMANGVGCRPDRIGEGRVIAPRNRRQMPIEQIGQRLVLEARIDPAGLNAAWPDHMNPLIRCGGAAANLGVGER